MVRNGKKNEFYDELVESMTQALAYTRGDQAKGRSVCPRGEALLGDDAQQIIHMPHGKADTEKPVTNGN